MEKQTQKTIPFFRLLVKNLLLEILITILCALVAFGISIYTDKTYYTVNQSVMLRTSIQSGLGQASQSSNASHGKLYMPMVEDSITNPEAIKAANALYQERYPDASDTIESKDIEVTYKDNSLIFNISYTDLSEEKAKEKLSVVFEVANEQLRNDIKGEVKLILTDGVDEDGGVRYYSIVTSDGTLENTLLGAAIGVALAVLIVLLKHVTDNTVKDKEEFEALTGVSVISYVEKDKKES